MKRSAVWWLCASALMLLCYGMAACAGVPLRQPSPLRGLVEQRLWQSVRRQQESRHQLRARLRVRPVGVAGWAGESEWEVLAQRGGRLLLARRSVLTQPDLVITSDGHQVCARDPDGCGCRSVVSLNKGESSSRHPFVSQACSFAEPQDKPDERRPLRHPESVLSDNEGRAKDLPTGRGFGEVLPRCARQDDGKDARDDRAEDFVWSRIFPLAMSPAEISSMLLGVLPVFDVDAMKEADQVDGCELETMTVDRRERLARVQLSCLQQGGRGVATVRLSDGALLRYEQIGRAHV